MSYVRIIIAAIDPEPPLPAIEATIPFFIALALVVLVVAWVRRTDA